MSDYPNQSNVIRFVSPRRQLDYLIERRRFDGASRVLSKLLARRPEDPNLLYYGAYIDYHQGRREQADHTVKTILSLDPSHANARTLLFWLHKVAQRSWQAEQVIVDLIEEYPNHAFFYAEYSMLMYETERFEKAQELAEQALRLAPDDKSALHASAVCASVIDRSLESNYSLQELVHRYPNSFRTQSALATALANCGRSTEALRVAQELLRDNPDNEELVDMVRQFTERDHWLLKPLWFVRRFRWVGIAAVLVVLLAVALTLMLAFGPTVMLVAVAVVLGFASALRRDMKEL